jgi:type VI secretion system secreted protein VgrG
MATFTQAHRLLSLTTPLGADKLLLAGFSGREELSRLFRYDLELLSDDDAVSAKDIVGKGVTWVVRHVDSEPRTFHGVVRRFVAGPRQYRQFRAYRAEVVPWLWFLTRTSNCRIFQNKTAPEIIQQVFDDLNFKDYQLNVKRGCVKRDYCVQYRETAFQFVSRLMEEEGIFYFFKHEKGKHTLVLGDSPSACRDVPESPVAYATGTRAQNHVSAWEHRYEFRSGKWAQTDYNFEAPGASLLTGTNTLLDLAGADRLELFDYPGLYQKKPDGEALIKLRMEEEETDYDVATGASRCCTFTPGGTFTLKGHDCEAENQAYLITAVEHRATDTSYTSTDLASEYGNTFTCVPASVPYRPARTTPKPTVQGPQTAVVVGPKGQEIHVDKYGRVKVQFHWDRLGQKDEKSSCWVRVAENWAGGGWGMAFHPRVGQEVVVDFLEGDPDRPLITGRVYNAGQMPPYALPDHMTASTIKTRSTPDGGPDNFNELRFEDKKGSEEIYFHAEKDFNRVVENNDTLKVGFDKQDKGDQRTEIFNNQSLKVGCQQASDGSQTVEIWKNRQVQIRTGHDTLTIKRGDQTTKVELGACSTEAMQSIELKVGQSSIKLEPTCITLKAMNIKIEGDMLASVKSKMATQLEAGVTLSARGAITKIG